MSLILVSAQFEASDDPLEKITTAEAIRTLIDFYRTSHFFYTAKEKVEGISKVVSFSSPIDYSHDYFGGHAFVIFWHDFVACRKELC